jgi:hypothetical protein
MLTPPQPAAPIDLSTLAPGELVTEAKAATILDCSRATLANARSLGRGPAFVKVGTMVRYFRSTLTEWTP